MRGRAPALDPTELRHLIEVKTLTQQEAARQLGVSVSCVERTCKRLGLKTQRTGPRSGIGHTNWKGGRVLVGRYWYIFAPSHPNATKRGYVAEHRMMMSLHLGRALRREEVVHHVDGDPQNNAIENLALFGSNAEHLRHELTGRVPNHSPEGKVRMLEGLRRWRSLRASKPDGQEST